MISFLPDLKLHLWRQRLFVFINLSSQRYQWLASNKSSQGFRSTFVEVNRDVRILFVGYWGIGILGYCRSLVAISQGASANNAIKIQSIDHSWYCLVHIGILWQVLAGYWDIGILEHRDIGMVSKVGCGFPGCQCQVAVGIAILAVVS